MGLGDRDLAELETMLAERAPTVAPDLTGPFKILAVSPRGPAAIRCEVNAYRLVPVDAADTALREVFVPVPVSGWVELLADGTVDVTSLPPPGADEVREARAFARGLIERGVSGLGAGPRGGPPTRATHEVQTDARGRRVIRRIGFSAG